ncbi:hypothetical protein FOCC_FOCC016125 [Frankliniella occidentalis]|nr:hypothetical protein FOCC_FOCC016125 [Frankliniella occidentalis]
MFGERRRVQVRRMVVQRKVARDNADSFERTEESFIRRYRLTKDLMWHIIDSLRPLAVPKRSPLSIAFEIKVLCIVRFFATGTYQTIIGDTVDLALTQETVSDIIKELLPLFIHPRIKGKYVKFPRTREEAQVFVDRFCNVHLLINTLLLFMCYNFVVIADCI